MAQRAGALPIQRALDDSNLHHAVRGTGVGRRLLASVAAHNAAQVNDGNTQADIHAQLSHLDDVEHEIYRWFDRNKGNENHPARASMFGLMDQVQQHHRELIRRTVAGGHSLWVHGDVSATERGRIDAVWNQVVGNAGNLSLRRDVTDSTGNQYQLPQGDYDALHQGHLADTARLMSRPRGRKLVEHLHRKGANATQEVVFGMHSLPELRGHGMGPPQITPKAVNRGVLSMVGRGGASNARGPGGATDVWITPGLKDSDMSDFSHQGRRIVSPTFIGLGHELVHAGHYQQGSYLPGNDRGDEIPGVRADYHGDLEEYLAVERTVDQRAHANNRGKQRRVRGRGGNFPLARLLDWNSGVPTENDIREEHGITLRHGHTSMATPEMYAGSRVDLDPSTFITAPSQIATQIHTAQQQALMPPPPQAESWFRRAGRNVLGGGRYLGGLGYNLGASAYRRVFG